MASIEIRLCPFSRLTSIRRWRAQGYLECVAGRITEESFEKFCCNHPEKIPYWQLNKKIQLWLDGFGYPANEGFRIGELAAMLHVSPKTVRRWISLTWLQVRQDRITRESVAQFCGLHPEMIRCEVLSSESRELLTRTDRPGGSWGFTGFHHSGVVGGGRIVKLVCNTLASKVARVGLHQRRLRR